MEKVFEELQATESKVSVLMWILQRSTDGQFNHLHLFPSILLLDIFMFFTLQYDYSINYFAVAYKCI